jgi:SAM-dependent methyltransferase
MSDDLDLKRMHRMPAGLAKEVNLPEASRGDRPDGNVGPGKRGLSDQLRDFYHTVYNAVCGEQPHKRPWHYSWLATRDLYADLARVLPTLRGLILDIGCGSKPYRQWATSAEGYLGIDVSPSSKADALVESGKPWPFKDNCFDAVLCTQVLEYVGLHNALIEMRRVLKPGGYVVVTAPFLHPQEPGADCRRFSLYGIKVLFAEGYEVTDLHSQGRIGSVLGLAFLGWMNAELNHHSITLFLKAAFFPFWVLFCAFVNSLGFLLDLIDSTGVFYTNVMLIARKIPDELPR